MIAGNGVPCGIAISEIESYARMFGFDTMADRFDLMHYVRHCDDVWMNEVKKRSSKKTNAPAGKHTPRRR